VVQLIYNSILQIALGKRQAFVGLTRILPIFAAGSVPRCGIKSTPAFEEDDGSIRAGLILLPL
jgi:hypothetical protein